MQLPIFLSLLFLLCFKVAHSIVLSPDYYTESCPNLQEIIRQNVKAVIFQDPTMAASLLRLHFHDCFVLGCDASILLDSVGGTVSEKEAGPNRGSVRGFEVIDRIKAAIEEACPLSVSCADILALVARDSVHLRGGPTWEVPLGRRDSIIASFSGANQMIPAPNFTLEMLISNFQSHGLDIVDLVTLSGSHTIGRARCVSFKQRLYNDQIEEEVDDEYRSILRSICPKSGNRDNSRVPLDLKTSRNFDNVYYLNLIDGMGLLQTDQYLISGYIVEQRLMNLIWAYAANQELFFREFAKSMIKMAGMNVLTSSEGEVRQNCRFLN